MPHLIIELSTLYCIGDNSNNKNIYFFMNLFKQKGYYNKINETIEQGNDNNGRLRRAIAQSILIKHVYWAILICLIFTLIASISGTGKGIDIAGIHFPPISASALNIITTVIVYMLTRLMDNVQIILNYFFTMKDGEIQPHKTIMDTNKEFQELKNEIATNNTEEKK